MPNWCDNTLTLTHDDPKMIYRAVRAFKKGNFLAEFIPMPEALSETLSGSYGDADKQAALEAQQEHNRQTYGYSTWYDFCLSEWGTKWDIGGRDEPATRLDQHSAHFYFQSAWAPPCEAYKKFEQLGFSINALFYEPGAGFAGQYYDGQEYTYDLSGQTSETIRDLLPAELDEEFNISEQMADWEAEQQDD